MAYNTKKGIDIIGGFKPGLKQPLDIRTKVATIAERDELVTSHVAYAGLSVWVHAENKAYEWNGTEWKSEVTGTAYTHPDTHPATMITEDETHRFVTDDEKAAWDAKASTNVATTEANGLMSAADKTKFDEMSTGFADKVDKTRTINGHALSENITLSADDVEAIPLDKKGVANGVAELDANGTVNQDQLPAYVDDAIDIFIVDDKFYLAVDGAVVDVADTVEVGPEIGKIYVDIENNKGYRWSGSTYTKLSEGIALGEVEGSAYRGDRGKIAYDHSQLSHAPADAQKNVQPDWNQTDTAADDFIQNKPTSIEVSGGDADTVGGHTVGTDVPENAVFTDTTYEVFNDTKDGLVPKTGELTKEQLKFLTDSKTWQSIGLNIEEVDVTTEDGTTTTNVLIKLLDGEGNNVTNSVFPTVSNNGYGLMTPELFDKLQSISEGATAYEHPETHPATMITEDETHKFVTDTQINEWNAKASKDTATAEAAGLLSAVDKEKINGLEEGADAYIHPDTHPATMIVEDNDHKFATNTDIAIWNGTADIYTGISEKDRPSTAPTNSLFLQTISGASIEETYKFYDANANIGIDKNNVWIDTNTGEEKSIKSWTYYSTKDDTAFDDSDSTEKSTVAVSDDGETWYYLYPDKHVDESVVATAPETYYTKPQIASMYDYLDNDLTSDNTKRIGMMKISGEDHWFLSQTKDVSASEPVDVTDNVSTTPIGDCKFISVNNDELLLVKDSHGYYHITDIIHIINYSGGTVRIDIRSIDVEPAEGQTINVSRYNWQTIFQTYTYTENCTDTNMTSIFIYSKSHDGKSYRIDMDDTMVMYNGWNTGKNNYIGAWASVFRYTAANKAKLDACTDIVKKNSYNNAKPMIVYLVNLQFYDSVNKRFFTNLNAKALSYSYNENGSIVSNQGISASYSENSGKQVYLTIVGMKNNSDSYKYYVVLGAHRATLSSQPVPEEAPDLNIRIFTDIRVNSAGNVSYMTPYTGLNKLYLQRNLYDGRTDHGVLSCTDSAIKLSTLTPVTI